MSDPIIRIRDMHKWFPGVHALNNVQLDLYPGEVHALMGENGAGKSTLIKIIAGVYNFDEGKYEFEGKPAQICTPQQAIGKGISVIYQELNLVEGISIAENVYFGNLPKTKLGRVKWKQLYSNTQAILDELGLKVSPKLRVSYLSTAQKQLVEIGKALSHNAKVIVMDEPTSALASKEIITLFDIIRKLRAKQVAIIYISHKLDEVFTIADKITMFRDGCWIESKKASEYTNESIIAAMVGRELSEMYPKTESKIGEKVLEVSHLTSDKVKDVSFYIREGEIVSFCGLMGAGRSELAKAVFGADKRLAGEILVASKKVPADNPPAARKLGIGFMSEDRKTEGNLSNMSVAENITIASLDHFSKFGNINKRAERTGAASQVKALNIKTPSIQQLIIKLSGGNQQKVLLARWLINQNLRVLIIDEPTRGIDVGAKAEIYSIINQLTKKGLAVCMMSSEMPELLGMSDRIYIMRGGKIVGEMNRDEATQEALMEYAVGKL